MVKFFIQKPIAVLMITLALVILGVIGGSTVPISLIPPIDVPKISVQVYSKNLSARELEDAVIKPLRSQLLQISHLAEIKSEASNGIGTIQLHFDFDAKVDYSFIEVNEKVDRAMTYMPKDIERPRVIKASATDIPVFYLNLTLRERDDLDNTDQITQEFLDFNRLVSQVIRRRIEQIPEVAMADINGLVSSEILIIPNHEKLLALGIGVEDLESAIKNQHSEAGSILVRNNQYQYNLHIGSGLGHIREIANVFVKKDDRVFRLKELAEIKEQPQKRTGLVLSDG